MSKTQSQSIYTFTSRLLKLEWSAPRLLAFPRWRHDGTHTRVDAVENPEKPGVFTPHTKDPRRRRRYDFVDVRRTDIDLWYEHIAFQAGCDWLFATQPVSGADPAGWIVWLPKHTALQELFERHFVGKSAFTTATILACYKDFRRLMRRGGLAEVVVADLDRLQCPCVVSCDPETSRVVIRRIPVQALRIDEQGREERFTLSWSEDPLLWFPHGWYATPANHSQSLFARVIAPTLHAKFRNGLGRLLSVFKVQLDWKKFDQSVHAIVEAGPPVNALAAYRWERGSPSLPPDRPPVLRIESGSFRFAPAIAHSDSSVSDVANNSPHAM